MRLVAANNVADTVYPAAFRRVRAFVEVPPPANLLIFGEVTGNFDFWTVQGRARGAAAVGRPTSHAPRGGRSLREGEGLSTGASALDGRPCQSLDMFKLAAVEVGERQVAARSEELAHLRIVRNNIPPVSLVVEGRGGGVGGV